MSPRITLSVAARVLRQLRHDPRTIALLLVVPVVLLVLVRYVLDDADAFDRIGVPMLGLFPLITMFLATSITMLRERTTGHARTADDDADGEARPAGRLRDCLWRGRRAAGGARLRGRLRLPRSRHRPFGGARDRAGDRQRPPGDVARPLRQRLRQERVPGGAVHAGVPAPADPALRPVPAARRDGAGARHGQRLPAAHLRLRRPLARGPSAPLGRSSRSTWSSSSARSCSRWRLARRRFAGARRNPVRVLRPAGTSSLSTTGASRVSLRPRPNWVDQGALSLGIASYAIVDGGEALVYDTHVSVEHARRFA